MGTDVGIVVEAAIGEGLLEFATEIIGAVETIGDDATIDTVDGDDFATESTSLDDITLEATRVGAAPVVTLVVEISGLEYPRGQITARCVKIR